MTTRPNKTQDESRFSQFKERKATATKAYSSTLQEPETAARHRNAGNGHLLPMTPILFIDTNHGFGGDTVALLNMVEVLNEHRIPVAVACIDGGALCQRLLFHPAVHLLRLPLPLRASVSRATFLRRMAAASRILTSYCWRNNVRLAHLNTNVAGSGQFLACMTRLLSLGRIPLVYHAHCSPKSDPLTRMTLALSSQVWAVSDYTATQHRAAGIPDNKISVLPNLVREPATSNTSRTDWRTQLNLPHDAIILSLVGRLSPNKGQQIAIDALALLPPNLPCHLLLAGDDRVPDGNHSFREDLEQQVARLDLKHRVHFLGHVNDPTSVFAQSAVVLVPSDDESFCLSAAEAVVARVPVIAADRSALREVVGRTAGLPVVERTPEAFARALLRLLSKPSPDSPTRPAERLLSAYGPAAFRNRYFQLLSQFQHLHLNQKEPVHA